MSRRKTQTERVQAFLELETGIKGIGYRPSLNHPKLRSAVYVDHITAILQAISCAGYNPSLWIVRINTFDTRGAACDDNIGITAAFEQNGPQRRIKIKYAVYLPKADNSKRIRFYAMLGQDNKAKKDPDLHNNVLRGAEQVTNLIRGL